MEKPSSLLPETAKATSAKNSTSRTQKHRAKMAAEGGIRLDVPTSEEIKAQIGLIAKQEKITSGIAGESLLFLGIETYLQGSKGSYSNIPRGISNPTGEGEARAYLAANAIAPRHRIELHVKHTDRPQTDMAKSLAGSLPTTTLEPADEDIFKTVVNNGEKSTTTDVLPNKPLDMRSRVRLGGMDREKHKIWTVGPVQPTGKLHSDNVEFGGQPGYFYVGVITLGNRRFESIFFRSASDGKDKLMTDFSNDREIQAELERIRANQNKSECQDNNIQNLEIDKDD